MASPYSPKQEQALYQILEKYLRPEASWPQLFDKFAYRMANVRDVHQPNIPLTRKEKDDIEALDRLLLTAEKKVRRSEWLLDDQLARGRQKVEKDQFAIEVPVGTFSDDEWQAMAEKSGAKAVQRAGRSVAVLPRQCSSWDEWEFFVNTGRSRRGRLWANGPLFRDSLNELRTALRRVKEEVNTRRGARRRIISRQAFRWVREFYEEATGLKPTMHENRNWKSNDAYSGRFYKFAVATLQPLFPGRRLDSPVRTALKEWRKEKKAAMPMMQAQQRRSRTGKARRQ